MKIKFRLYFRFHIREGVKQEKWFEIKRMSGFVKWRYGLLIYYQYLNYFFIHNLSAFKWATALRVCMKIATKSTLIIWKVMFSSATKDITINCSRDAIEGGVQSDLEAKAISHQINPTEAQWSKQTKWDDSDKKTKLFLMRCKSSATEANSVQGKKW